VVDVNLTEQLQAHYVETMGSVPAAIAAMFDMDEEFAAAYTKIRKLIYDDRENGLPLHIKESYLVLLDISVDNASGALNHLAAAKRAGFNAVQLKELLLCAFLVRGVAAFGKVGHELWNAFEDIDG